MTAGSPSTPATLALERAGIPFTPHVYERHETATNFGEEAAAALGGKKATLAQPALAEKRTGYVVGGISPVGQKTRLRTVVDASALEHPSIFVSGGRRGFDIEVAPEDLVRVTEASTAPIART